MANRVACKPQVPSGLDEYLLETQELPLLRRFRGPFLEQAVAYSCEGRRFLEVSCIIFWILEMFQHGPGIKALFLT